MWLHMFPFTEPENDTPQTLCENLHDHCKHMCYAKGLMHTRMPLLLSLPHKGSTAQCW
jgi:hypothetical protein